MDSFDPRSMAVYSGPTQSCSNAIISATTDTSKSHATFNGGGCTASSCPDGYAYGITLPSLCFRNDVAPDSSGISCSQWCRAEATSAGGGCGASGNENGNCCSGSNCEASCTGVVAALYEQGATAAGRALAYSTPPLDFVGQLLPISVTASYQAVGTLGSHASDEGSDVATLTYGQASECEAACDADSQCRHFTACPGDGNKCYLKTGTSRVADQTGVGKRGSAERGVEGAFDPPEHLLTSFHTVLIVEFGGHLPTLPSF
jgi:hypothetical protein